MRLLDGIDKSKPLICITHKNCKDGYFSYRVVKAYCDLNGIECVLMEKQYGEDIPALNDGDQVIMTDFSYPRDIIEDLHQRLGFLLVIDHHKTAKEELKGLDYCVFDMFHSGCVLTWKTLFGNNPIPEILLYVEDRDLWNWKLENSQEFSAGLATYSNKDLDPNPYILNDSDFLVKCKDIGKVILKNNDAYIEKKTKKVLENNNTFNILGTDMLCINNTHLISEVGNELSRHHEAHASVQFFITDEDIVFSFRSIGDTDISIIAKALGGGGHKNAAGASMKIKDFDINKFLRTRSITKEDIHV